MTFDAKRYAGRLVRHVRNHIVFAVALVAALASIAVAPPWTNFMVFVDYKTVACLFCILAAVGTLTDAGMMDAVARLFGRAFSTPRIATCSIVGMTMLLSMFVTNDMALVVMLPLAAAVLRHEGWMAALPFCFIMQNLAANLGGMILPFGNPQNLFLFGFFAIPFDRFLRTMAVPFGVSVAMVFACCAVITPRYGKRNAGDAGESEADKVSEKRAQRDEAKANGPLMALGAALFALTVAAVFRAVPFQAVTVVVIVALAVFDRKALVSVDWYLLGTFVCFFIFAGNVSILPPVREALAAGMQAQPLLVSAGASQIISNVPAAVLLAQVTDAWQPLLVGVNIGGAGTIVASLASLITIDRYRTLMLIGGAEASRKLPSPRRFMVMLMGYGSAFLAVLVGVCLVV